MLRKKLHVLLTLVMMLMLPTAALASQWVASKVAQPARYTLDNKNWVQIKRGMKIPKQSWIHTAIYVHEKPICDFAIRVPTAHLWLMEVGNQKLNS